MRVTFFKTRIAVIILFVGLLGACSGGASSKTEGSKPVAETMDSSTQSACSSAEEAINDFENNSVNQGEMTWSMAIASGDDNGDDLLGGKDLPVEIYDRLTDRSNDLEHERKSFVRWCDNF
ncbi:MAG: hypothetical protein WCG37_11350 [Actinomycetes bacterium]